MPTSANHTTRSHAILVAAMLIGSIPASAQELRVELKPTMLTNEAEVGDPSGIIDEQRQIIGPPFNQLRPRAQ